MIDRSETARAMIKPFRTNARVSSVCGLRGRIIDRAVIGDHEFYIVQIGSDRRDQIARLHHELTQEA